MQWGQREEDECNNQIKVEYVGGEWEVDDTTRGAGRGRKARRQQKTRQKWEERTTRGERVADDGG
jgi:hypothetical protein